jgi:hypothetical protein
LKNINHTNYKYLLTTTYVPHDSYANRDIKTGDFRIIDLFSSPYSFPKDKVELSINEPPEYKFDRSMVLLRKSDVPTNLELSC